VPQSAVFQVWLPRCAVTGSCCPARPAPGRVRGTCGVIGVLAPGVRGFLLPFRVLRCLKNSHARDRRMSVVGYRTSNAGRVVNAKPSFAWYRADRGIVRSCACGAHGALSGRPGRSHGAWPVPQTCASLRCAARPGAAARRRVSRARALPAIKRCQKIIYLLRNTSHCALARCAFSALAFTLHTVCNNGMWSIRENPQAQPMCHTLLRHNARRTPNEVKHRSAPKPTQRSPATGQF
jgi:hypothetical protein